MTSPLETLVGIGIFFAVVIVLIGISSLFERR